MAYIEKIAFHLKRRDEVPNQELAALLASEENKTGIKEIASYLNDKNKSIASDCLKVLYEIGYLSPHLIKNYAEIFISLLENKNNRMVWGSMIALANISELVPDQIWPHRELILELIETGTVITSVWGVNVLIGLSKSNQKCYSLLKVDLLRLQEECRDVDFAKRAELMWKVFKPEEILEYKKILETRLPDLSTSAQKRLSRVIKKIK